uniref:Ubiquitin-like domain-containing protein n=1 Tax=Haptolina brevifila TaxID=156173 RepID=A0A7S2JGK9_9EUKA|mmetsp:Transcript_82047/g.163378  ORF Transcript_82047/g.163378 Transcript_82047/m.163378 type:complete len:740 (+) Transcript_82047:149-2368(+)
MASPMNMIGHDELNVVLKKIGPAGVATFAATATTWHTSLRDWRANESSIELPLPRPGGFALRVIGRHYTSLRTLDASGCKPINNDDVRFVVAGCPKLTKLDLSGCPLRPGPHVVSYLRTRCRELWSDAEINAFSAGLDAHTNAPAGKLSGCLRSSVDEIRPGVELVYAIETINLKVVTQDGNEIYFKLKMTTSLSKVLNGFCQRQGVARRSVRFLYDGRRLDDCDAVTPEHLKMEDGDVVDVMVEQLCIAAPVPATFGLHVGTPGAHLLRQPEALAGSSAADAARLAHALGGPAALDKRALPQCFPEVELLDKGERAALMAYVDAQHREGGSAEEDLRCTVTGQLLTSLIGHSAFERLLAFFGGACDTVKLRRVQAHGRWVAFHTDYSWRTMQIALNGEDEYQGGRLLFATAHGFEQPRRPPGSATIHTNEVVHGVTALQAGTRYGLFFCDTRQSGAATLAVAPTYLSAPSAPPCSAAPASESLEAIEPTSTPATSTAAAAAAAFPLYASISSNCLGLSYLHAAVVAQFSYFERVVPMLDASDDSDLASHASEYLQLLPTILARMQAQQAELILYTTVHEAALQAEMEAQRVLLLRAGGRASVGMELMWRTHMLSPLRYLQAAANPRASSWDVQDLVAAAKRQHGSMHRMLALKPQLASRDAVEVAVCEYGLFLTSQQHSETPHIPTLMTDLVWHAHMSMCPARYGDECRRLAGHFVNHDDNGQAGLQACADNVGGGAA